MYPVNVVLRKDTEQFDLVWNMGLVMSITGLFSPSKRMYFLTITSNYGKNKSEYKIIMKIRMKQIKTTNKGLIARHF